MKAQDIFELVAMLTFSTTQADKDDYAQFFLPALNMLLRDNFEINNALRLARGKEALISTPLINDISEEVEYEEEFTRLILPFGCAGYIYADDDPNMAADYKNKYEYERTRVLFAGYEVTEDMWNASDS